MGDANEICYGAYRYRFACGGLRGGTASDSDGDADAFSYGDARAADGYSDSYGDAPAYRDTRAADGYAYADFRAAVYHTAIGPAGLGYGYAGSGVSARSGFRAGRDCAGYVRHSRIVAYQAGGAAAGV